MKDSRPAWARPLRLRPDNLTPPQRTPWGGDNILKELKAGLQLDAQGQVGESWELSVDPDFPSVLSAPDQGSLAGLLAAHPERMLGQEAPLGGTALLVKLLDSASPLSVQIHPPEGHPRLMTGQSGKPEAWLILGAQPWSGVWMGLREGVDERRMKRVIHSGQDASMLLNFVKVRPGDVFVVQAGTPHAIGPGVTLLEPQRVQPGRQGVTWRYWDWGRRYDEHGRATLHGTPRPLHLEDALAATDWDAPREAALLERSRARFGSPERLGPPRVEDLLAGLSSPWLGMQRFSGTGGVCLPSAPRLRALTVVAGELTLIDGPHRDTLRCGETAALPAGLPQLDMALQSACAVLSWTRSPTDG